MKKSILFLFIIFICLPKGVIAMEKKCIAEYLIDGTTNPWKGFTGSYEEEENSKFVEAGKIDGTEFMALPFLSDFNKNDVIMLGRSEKKRKVIINQEFFSDMQRTDATGNNKDKVLGNYKDLSFSYFSPRELIVFLLKAQLIITYWHIESNLCLDLEEDSKDVYKAHFSGEHIYFTNRKNVNSLAFSVSIDKKSGTITVSMD